jgi:hypothetical protein
VRVRRTDAVEAVLGSAALFLFVVYFGIHCFRYPWGGDLLRHSASVSSLYRNFAHPSHEAMAVAGNQSEVHTPYIVAVATAGRMLGVTPYRALQLAGVANLLLYAWAVWFFFRTFSLLPGSWVPPVVFLLVSLFLRNRLFWWASETSFASIRLIQAYPSLFGWAVALTAFSLAERYLRRPRFAYLAVLVVLVWSLVLSHNLTGSWVVLILGLRALLALFAAPKERRLAFALGATVAGAIALTPIWPYFDIFGARGLLGIPEASEFGDHPFRDLAGLYALALPAAGVFLRFRKHVFWVAGFVATFAALQLFRSLGFDYGNRYAFFQAFFAQAIVAEAAGLSIAILLRQRWRLPEDFSVQPALRAAAISYLGAVILLTVAAPAAWEERREDRGLLSFAQLAESPPTHDAYYAQLGEIGRHLSGNDVVMMPVEHATWNVAAITGAHVVVSPFAYRVPDYADRVRDVARYFSPGCPASERHRIARRYGVTKVLVTLRYLDRAVELAGALGQPIAQTPTLTLFRAGMETRGSTSERLRQRNLLAEGPVVVELRHGRRVSVAHDPALVDPHGAPAVLADLRERVRDEENRFPGSSEVLDSVVALPLETLVSDRERFVHEQDVGLDVGRDRECEARGHARRVGPDRRVDEFLDLRPLDDACRAASHLRPGEPEERPLQDDVLAPGQLGVEAEAELQQWRDVSDHDDPAGGGRHDARDEAEKGALPGAVSADHADRFSRLNVQADLVEGLELVEQKTSLQASDRVLLERPDPFAREAVPHRDPFELDDGGQLRQPRKANRSARFEK